MKQEGFSVKSQTCAWGGDEAGEGVKSPKTGLNRSYDMSPSNGKTDIKLIK